jgi:hypothetical protein
MKNARADELRKAGPAAIQQRGIAIANSIVSEYFVNLLVELKIAGAE